MEVSIRPLREEDAYTSYKWRNDPDVFKYTANTYSHVITLESELNWIRKVIKNECDFRCAIEVDGTYIGNVYLTDMIGGSANYHIFIGDKRYWGKGIAKKASNLIIERGFSTLQLQRIHLEVHVGNTRALSLYKSLGFTEVANDGNWTKMVLIHG